MHSTEYGQASGTGESTGARRGEEEGVEEEREGGGGGEGEGEEERRLHVSSLAPPSLFPFSG